MRFDVQAAWLAIQTYFNNTSSAVNFFDAKEEYDSVVWNKSISNDTIAFEQLVSDLTTASDILNDVHGQPVSESTLILDLGVRLPDRYLDSFRVVKRLPAADLTYLNACQYLREDIWDKVKRDKTNSKAAAIDVANLTKQQQQQNKKRQQQVQREQQDQRGGRGRSGRGGQRGRGNGQLPRDETSCYVAGVPPPNYTGCHICNSKHHYERDCPRREDAAFKRQKQQQQYAP